MRRLFLFYLIAINIVTFLIYGIDKWKAKRGTWRVPESRLLWLAAAGGSVGAWCGMQVWHHKTLHNKFRYGVPAILVAQLIIFGYFLHL